MTAWTIPTFMLAKSAGSEYCISTCEKICHFDAFKIFIRFLTSGGIDSNPSIMPDNTGNSTMEMIRTTFDISPIPNQITNSGTRAIFGAVCRKIRYGISIVFNASTLINIYPSTIPRNAPITNPRMTSYVVVQRWG